MWNNTWSWVEKHAAATAIAIEKPATDCYALQGGDKRNAAALIRCFFRSLPNSRRSLPAARAAWETLPR